MYGCGGGGRSTVMKYSVLQSSSKFEVASWLKCCVQIHCGLLMETFGDSSGQLQFISPSYLIIYHNLTQLLLSIVTHLIALCIAVSCTQFQRASQLHHRETFGFSHQIPFVWINAQSCLLSILVRICSLWTGKHLRWDEVVPWGNGGKSCLEARDVICYLVKTLSQTLSSLLAVLKVYAGFEMFAFHFHFGFWQIYKSSTGWMMHNYCNCNNYDILQNSFLHTNEMLFILRHGKVAFQSSKQASLKCYFLFIYLFILWSVSKRSWLN